MFSHFIYFIIALLILSLYEAPVHLPIGIFEALILFTGLILIYVIYIRFLFNRLLRRVEWDSQSSLDHQFGRLGIRCTILALLLLAADVWWLHLPGFLNELPVFTIFPTLSSLLFLLLFVGHLALLWMYSYRAHRAIYRTDICLGNYVYSNVAFSVPVLIPWTLLFGLNDLIALLPYELPNRLLETPLGQTGYFLIFLVVAAIFTPVLIQRFWRCRPLESGELRTRIEDLCRRANVRYANIVYWPIFGGRMITAGVMGLVPRFRYILVTEALLTMLTPEELDQVIAHEIGHVKHRHLLLYLLFFIGFMLITYTIYPLSELLFFSKAPIINAIDALQFDPLKVHDIFLGVTLVICIIVYFRFIFGFFIRNFERQADTYVFNLFSSARPLITTFGKIVSSSGQPADKPNWHHFSIQQRVDYLWRCEQSRRWISRQNRKVSKSISIFIVAVLILGVGSFHLNKVVFDKGRRHINISVIETYLEQKREKTDDDALLYLFVGNFHLENMNHQKAVAAYVASLALTPDNPNALNNLAWLLATATESTAFNPARALELAQKAIALKKAPHIWDTLAECFFANGRIEEAIAAEEQALRMDPEDDRIYLDQLNRFNDALKTRTRAQ